MQANLNEEWRSLKPMQSLVMNDYSQNQDIPPQELSGDENAEKSILIQTDAFSPVKASIFLSVTLLMKTMIGVGILSLPFVFSTMGIIPTIIMYGLAGTLTHFTSSLLIKAKNLSGHSNYSSIMHYIHPHKAFKIMISLTLMSGNLGTCILDLIFFKTTVRKLFEDTIGSQQTLDSFFTSQYMILIVVAIVQFPITMLIKVQKLRIFSFLGVSGIAIFILAFLVYYFIEISKGVAIRNMEIVPDDWNKAIATIPNIIFSLTFQSNFFPIFKGLQSSSDRRMTKVVMIGTWLCISAYLLLGLLGFSITSSKVISPNFLQEVSYQSTNLVLFSFMNGGFLVSLFFSFPIIFFSCRNNFISIIKVLTGRQEAIRGSRWRSEKNSIAQISDYVREYDVVEKRRKVQLLYALSTMVNILVIMLIAMFVENIESVFNLVGAVSCSAQSILFPLYFYLRMTHVKRKKKKTIYYVSMVVLAIMLPFCLYSVVALYI